MKQINNECLYSTQSTVNEGCDYDWHGDFSLRVQLAVDSKWMLRFLLAIPDALLEHDTKHDFAVQVHARLWKQWQQKCFENTNRRRHNLTATTYRTPTEMQR